MRLPASDAPVSASLPGVTETTPRAEAAPATQDHTVHPDLQRWVSKRMGATVTEVASSHVPMLSQPDIVIDVIRKAAAAVQNG